MMLHELWAMLKFDQWNLTDDCEDIGPFQLGVFSSVELAKSNAAKALGLDLIWEDRPGGEFITDLPESYNLHITNLYIDHIENAVPLLHRIARNKVQNR